MIVYYPARYFFLRTKEPSISFDKIDYYVDQIKWRKFTKIFFTISANKMYRLL